MEKQLKVDLRGHSMLSPDEMRNIKGGGLTDTVIKLVLAGMDYCFRMGIREAKRMKALL